MFKAGHVLFSGLMPLTAGRAWALSGGGRFRRDGGILPLDLLTGPAGGQDAPVTTTGFIHTWLRLGPCHGRIPFLGWDPMSKIPHLVIAPPGLPAQQFKLQGARIGVGPPRPTTISGSITTPSPASHCELTQNAAGGYDIKELGSTNGTLINGTDLLTHTLVPGDPAHAWQGSPRLLCGTGSGRKKFPRKSCGSRVRWCKPRPTPAAKHRKLPHPP